MESSLGTLPRPSIPHMGFGLCASADCKVLMFVRHILESISRLLPATSVVQAATPSKQWACRRTGAAGTAAFSSNPNESPWKLCRHRDYLQLEAGIHACSGCSPSREGRPTTERCTVCHHPSAECSAEDIQTTLMSLAAVDISDLRRLMEEGQLAEVPDTRSPHGNPPPEPVPFPCGDPRCECLEAGRGACGSSRPSTSRRRRSEGGHSSSLLPTLTAMRWASGMHEDIDAEGLRRGRSRTRLRGRASVPDDRSPLCYERGAALGGPPDQGDLDWGDLGFQRRFTVLQLLQELDHSEPEPLQVETWKDPARPDDASGLSRNGGEAFIPVIQGGSWELSRGSAWSVEALAREADGRGIYNEDRTPRLPAWPGLDGSVRFVDPAEVEFMFDSRHRPLLLGRGDFSMVSLPAFLLYKGPCHVHVAPLKFSSHTKSFTP